MIANIVSDDALILPHRANPAGLNFRERQVMFLEMADDGLNGGTPFELALDLRRDAALLA